MRGAELIDKTLDRLDDIPEPSDEETTVEKRSPTIQTVLRMAERYHDRATTQSGALTSKASSLCQMAGVTLSILFTVATLAADKLAGWEKALVLGDPVPWLASLMFASFALLVGSLLAAVWAVCPKEDVQVIAWEKVFDDQATVAGTNTYTKFITSHLWDVAELNYEANKKRGVCLKYAHYLYVASCVLMACLGGVIILCVAGT